MTAGGTADTLRGALEHVLAAQHRPGQVENLARLSGGASRETWAFDLRTGAATEPLILRRDPPGAPRLHGTTLETEAALIAAAADAGVPEPAVIASGDDLDGSAFLVMTRVEGQTIPRRILRDEALAAARGGLARDCGRILARIHRLDAGRFPALPRADPLEQWREVLDACGQPHPALEVGLRWLAANRPPAWPATVVHGDFRNGNLIVGADGIRAVLDWELAHAGDPLEDLGWLCVRAWRFGVDKEVGGFGDLAELVSAYEEESGLSIDVDAVRWWQAVGTLRWAVICILQVMSHQSGVRRSVELAAIGRRVCEAEWDLLNLLPRPWSGT